MGGGGYLAISIRDSALESLTLVVAAVFFAEGILDSRRLFPVSRAFRGSGWIFFDAIVTLVLAYS